MNRSRCAALALLVSMAAVGCGDAFVVELGRGQVGKVVFDRIFPTGLRAADGCPSLRIPYGEVESAHGEVVVAPLSEGCLLSVHMEEAVLLSAGTMRAWAEALESYDLSALIAIDLIVDELVLDAGRRFPLVDKMHSLSIALEKRVLVDQDDLATLGTRELRLTIPQRLVDDFLEALEEGRAFTGTLDLRLVLREGAPIPPVIHIRTLLQPVLLVDGWSATF